MYMLQNFIFICIKGAVIMEVMISLILIIVSINFLFQFIKWRQVSCSKKCWNKFCGISSMVGSLFDCLFGLGKSLLYWMSTPFCVQVSWFAKLCCADSSILLHSQGIVLRKRQHVCPGIFLSCHSAVMKISRYLISSENTKT